MTLDQQTLESIARLICGDDAKGAEDRPDRFSPVCRLGTDLTRFFKGAGLDRFVHDGTSRNGWVADCLDALDAAEQEKVVLRLADPRTYGGKEPLIEIAIRALNQILAIEGLRVSIDSARPRISHVKPSLDLGGGTWTQS